MGTADIPLALFCQGESGGEQCPPHATDLAGSTHPDPILIRENGLRNPTLALGIDEVDLRTGGLQSLHSEGS